MRLFMGFIIGFIFIFVIVYMVSMVKTVQHISEHGLKDVVERVREGEQEIE